MRALRGWLPCAITVCFALSSYATQVAEYPEKEIRLKAQSKPEAPKEPIWSVAEAVQAPGVRVPGAASTYDLPLPKVYDSRIVPEATRKGRAQVLSNNPCPARLPPKRAKTQR